MLARIIMPAGRYIQILQSPQVFDPIISDTVRGGGVDFGRSYPIDDPLLSQMATTIAQKMESGFLDRLLVDALNTALAARILSHVIDPSKITLAPSNGLSRERLQRVCDYIVLRPWVRLPIAYRLIGLSTSRRSGKLYMVIDQKNLTGGT
jgi:hypothetical protein